MAPAANDLATDLAQDLTKDLPKHLERYVVEQNYSRYTPVDQAVWRYILRQLKNHLSTHGHPIYSEGLKKTGISIDSIPHIETINKKLNEMGWKAIPVSGFIPPAAFMEFQALGYMPIASDMRSLEHIFYTPAPDIVHEAAGHSPIIADQEYADYLKKYAQVAKFAIISEEDMVLYTAIRELSDIKENPSSTAKDIADAECKLKNAIESMTYVSEAALLGRMNWWTAEYGLYGQMEDPKIYGAGLLSSLGECRSCLDSKVEKIPLTIDCINYSYDITEPQPQLFVCESCVHLEKVLHELAEHMAFRQDGKTGMDKAIQAKTVNTVELSSGLQISGQLTHYLKDDQDEPIYLQFSGPCQLSHEFQQLGGHGTDFHSQGYGTAVGLLKGQERPLEDWSIEELTEFGFQLDQRVSFEFASGVKVEGNLVKIQQSEPNTQGEQKNIIMTFDRCEVKYGDRLLFAPEWGIYDLGLGHFVKRAFGGAADRDHYDVSKDFDVQVIPLKSFSDEEKKQQQIHEDIRHLRAHVSPSSSDSSSNNSSDLLAKVKELYSQLKGTEKDWLAHLELLEIAFELNRESDVTKKLHKDLDEKKKSLPQIAEQVELGLSVMSKMPLIHDQI